MSKSQHIDKSIQRTILLNPGPGTTSSGVKEALITEDTCPREADFGNLMKDICTGILKIGNAVQSHEVALFVASGTGAMEATLVSAVGENDKVLILTNGAYGLRMESICKTFRLGYSTLFSFGDYPEVSKVEEVLEKGEHTHLAVIHHETSTGMMNPVEELATLCQRYNVRLIVDAMSTYGAYPLDLSKVPTDYIFSSSNKCIQGMAGLSFVIFRKDRIDELKQNSRGFYFDVFKQWDGLLKNGQLRFTPPVQVCNSFLKAIEETLAEGIGNRWKRYTENWEILYRGFSEIGFTPFLKFDHQSKILLALKNDGITGFNFDAFHDHMFDNGVTIYPGVIPQTNTFRVAVIGDLYADDMKRVVSLSKSYFNALR